MTRRPQGGFTLVEMMTVVVIIGILAAIAVPFLTYPTDVETATRSAAAAIGEGSRLAVNRGPMPAQIVAVTGDGNRVMVDITAASPEAAPVFSISLQIETGPTTAAYYEVQKITMPNGVVLHGTSDEADLTGGAPVTTGNGSFKCAANGQCDPKSIYLSRRGGQDKYRIVIMPLSTAPLVFPGW